MDISTLSESVTNARKCLKACNKMLERARCVLSNEAVLLFNRDSR